MPAKKSDDGTCGCIIMAIIAIALVVWGWPKVFGDKKASGSDARIAGADPQAFKNASDLYSFTPKTTLSAGAYSTLMDTFDDLAARSSLPEHPSFRDVLLQLDGASDPGAVVDKLETTAAGYTALFASYTPVDNPLIPAEFNEASVEYKNGNYTQALELYRRILSDDPTHLDARNNMGLCDLHLGNNIAAAMQFELVLAASPNYLGAEQNLSVALERMGLTERAYQHAQHVVSEDAELPMAQYNLGWFETKLEHHTAASNAYDAALKAYADYPQALRARTIEKLQSGEKLSKTDLQTLPEEERKLASSTTPASTKPTVVQTQSPRWWWWVLMVTAILVLVGLWLRAASNSRDGGIVWGFFAGIILIIAVIVFAIWFRTSSVFGTILWIFAGANILIMIPASAEN